MNTTVVSNSKPKFDQVIIDIADYVMEKEINSPLAYQTARLCLMDALACAFLALQFPACTKLLGPIVPGANLSSGARVPGTSGSLDPVRAAFNFGTLIRWLDFNDTWLAAEWGHPSDNLGGILTIADYLSRNKLVVNNKSLTMRNVLTAMIKAYEIQGILALNNSFNRVGLDHVVLVKVATVAVVAKLLGADKETLCNAISLAWVDGQSLRTYRHAPNAGTRKSWAAGDATSRGVWLAMLAMRGEMGYPSALSAPQWGFYDVSFAGKPFVFEREYGSYVMENILLKISYPAEFHAQTAVECAVQLHPLVKDRFAEIERIELTTHQSAIRIISKAGPLHNPADRDHCLQYMVAIGLLKGNLTADDYEDHVAQNPIIDQLRAKMLVKEEQRFSTEYLEADKRSIANAVQIFFNDGSCTEQIVTEYPIGHQRRREQGIALLEEKFQQGLKKCFTATQAKNITQLLENQEVLEAITVDEFMKILVK